MKLTPPANPNYSAVVVALPATNQLHGCDNIVGVPLLGHQAIVGKDTAQGTVGVVFTAETALSEEYARVNDLHAHAHLNANPEAKGYLGDNRRIRALKLRGHRSDALFMPLESLAYTGVDVDELQVGDTFDTLNGHEICRKYELVRKTSAPYVEKNKRKTFVRVDQRHFPVHISTDNYFRVRDMIPADAEVIVSAKYHGTSWRGSNTVVARKLTRRDRVARRFGVKVQTTEHDHVFGSRRVLKDINDPTQNHHYSTDVWSETGARLGNILPAGFQLFGEIVGWTSDGAPVQAGYHYGIPHGTSELFIYRVAQVNPQGRVTDLSWDQVTEFCRDHGLQTVPVLWRGRHADLDVEQFMDVRFRDLGYLHTLPLGMDKKLVDEGIVVRVDGLVPLLAKAKSPAFLRYESKQLDNEVVDLESLGDAA